MTPEKAQVVGFVIFVMGAFLSFALVDLVRRGDDE